MQSADPAPARAKVEPPYAAALAAAEAEAEAREPMWRRSTGSAPTRSGQADKMGAEAAAEAVNAVPRPPRRALDDQILDVLRQEAARETRARESEAGDRPGGPQATGAAEGEPAEGSIEAAVRERIEMMKALDSGESVETDEVDEDGRPMRRKRRSKLPDVEEINSTLDGHESPSLSPAAAAPSAADAARTVAGRRRGFRLGFTFMVFAAIGVGAAYSYADRIVSAAPALAPGMEIFVERVDAGRLWLDAAALSATAAIRRMTEGSASQ